MRLRPVLAATALVVACSLAGCAGQSADGDAAAPPTTAPPTSAPAGPTPTPSAPAETARPAAYTLTASGIGVYVIGTTLMKLKGEVANEETAEGCPDWTIGVGTGALAPVGLVFYQGKLLFVSVDTEEVATRAGAKVGMTLATVRSKYPGGTKLDDGLGGRAWLVKSGDNALLFRFSGAGKVETIEAGVADTLEFRFTEGEGC